MSGGWKKRTRIKKVIIRPVNRSICGDEIALLKVFELIRDAYLQRTYRMTNTNAIYEVTLDMVKEVK